MSKEVWTYKVGDEDYVYRGRYDTKQEAINACREEILSELKGENVECYVGRAIYHIPDLDVDEVIYRLQAIASSECGEVADDFLCDLTTQQESELSDLLNDAIKRWLDRHDLWPTFGFLVDVEEI